MGTQLALLDAEPITQVTPSVDRMFEEFWRVFPKRAPYSNPKRPALLKFTALVRRHGIDPLKIVAAAVQYASLRVGEDPRFTVMAITWLNQHRWESDDSLPPGSGPTRNFRGSSYMEFARELAAHGNVFCGRKRTIAAVLLAPVEAVQSRLSGLDHLGHEPHAGRVVGAKAIRAASADSGVMSVRQARGVFPSRPIPVERRGRVPTRDELQRARAAL